MSLYIKTDVDIPVDIASGFTLDDVTDMTVWIEKGDVSLTKTLGSGITQYQDGFVLSIDRTEITTTGDYTLYARITDQGGKQRGINVSPAKLAFTKHPTNG